MSSSAVVDPDHAWQRWWYLWALASLPGVCLCVLLKGPSAALAVAVPTAAVGGTLVAMWISRHDQLGMKRFLAITCRTAVASGLIGISLMGIGALLASLATVQVMGLILSAPPVRERLRRLLGSAPRSAATRRDHRELSDPPRRPRQRLPGMLGEPTTELSDSQLCLAWRQSFVVLEHTTSVHDRTLLVALRQGYLDELERRNAAALRTWLSAGARAASGPDRYFGSDVGRPDAA